VINCKAQANNFHQSCSHRFQRTEEVIRDLERAQQLQRTHSHSEQTGNIESCTESFLSVTNKQRHFSVALVYVMYDYYKVTRHLMLTANGIRRT